MAKRMRKVSKRKVSKRKVSKRRTHRCRNNKVKAYKRNTIRRRGSMLGGNMKFKIKPIYSPSSTYKGTGWVREQYTTLDPGYDERQILMHGFYDKSDSLNLPGVMKELSVAGNGKGYWSFAIWEGWKRHYKLLKEGDSVVDKLHRRGLPNKTLYILFKGVGGWFSDGKKVVDENGTEQRCVKK